MSPSDRQFQQIERLAREYAQAVIDGNELTAYIILRWELPAAKSLARLVHK